MGTRGLLRWGVGLWLCVCGLLVGLTLPGTVARAATVPLTACDEGSLLGAISAAGPDGTVQYTTDCTVSFGPTITISKNVTLDANGHTVTFDGGNTLTLLYVGFGVTLTLNGLTFTHGRSCNFCAVVEGGAMYIPSGSTVVVTSSTFSDNSSIVGGGAIFNGGTLTVTNSTFSGNSAPLGGGILNEGRLTVTNSTFSDNSGNNGGGIANTDTLTVTNSTFFDNSAPLGGGIYTSTPATLTNTLVAHSPGGSDLGGSFSGSNNVISDGTGGLLPTNGNLLGTVATPLDPLLAPLGDYGGPTPTFALLPGSLAIDTGDQAACSALQDGTGNPLTTDQRGAGFARTVNGRCDIGAFESKGFTVTASGGSGQSTPINTAFANPLTATVTANDPNLTVTAGNVTFTVTPAPGGAQATFGPLGGCTVSADMLTATCPLDATGTATSPPLTANGTPGAYSVSATMSGIATATTFTLTNLAPLTLTPASLPSGNVGVAYSQTLAASGGTGPYTFAATGTLPPGVTLAADGTLAGTPTTAGTFPFIVTATDSGGNTGSQQYTVTIGNAVVQSVTLACGSTAAVPVGGTVTCVATAHISDGSTQPLTSGVTYTSSDPNIATVDPATGTITGMAAGTVTITASYPGVPAVQVTVTVYPPTLTGVQPPAPQGRSAGTAGGGATPPPAPGGRTGTGGSGSPPPAPTGR